MVVYVLVSTTDGYVYGVFDDEDKAFDYADCRVEDHNWEVYAREVL